MDKLTAAQLTELGDAFLLIAQAVGNYRYVNGAVLTAARKQQLRDAHMALLGYADDCYTGSVKPLMEAAGPSLDRLTAITRQINDSYQALAKVQKAINIAAAGVRLGGALFGKNPLAIADAISGLEAAWGSGAG